MSGRIAGLLFLAVCLVLAVLLLLGLISPIMSGSVFAVVLVLLGAASRGFRR